ncbi:hypothetical protein EVAR_4535_1 [Eumeta japonica]|uniref:Uncharacterized protein n=1 Tax=Eumeta variegata TaxID=151549 RepID=A0A4C1SYN2_EUMVA|nr:hypothetical protein EVAR_4535_1 [Eumeta japonica]
MTFGCQMWSLAVESQDIADARWSHARRFLAGCNPICGYQQTNRSDRPSSRNQKWIQKLIRYYAITSSNTDGLECRPTHAASCPIRLEKFEGPARSEPKTSSEVQHRSRMSNGGEECDDVEESDVIERERERERERETGPPKLSFTRRNTKAKAAT